MILLQRYIAAACCDKINTRLHHPTLSIPFITCLKATPTSTLKFPDDHEDLGSASSNPELEYDQIFLSLLPSIETSKPIPILLNQAADPGHGKLYTRETQAEFHSLLRHLLEKYIESVEQLTSYGSPNYSGPAKYNDALLNVVVFGGALFQLTTTSAIKKHLQAIEPHLRSGDHKHMDTSQDIENDPDLCSVQPSAIYENHIVPLWQSYLNWLKLMVGHFEALWILSAYIKAPAFSYEGVIIKVLMPPPVRTTMLSWKGLLESEHFPGAQSLMGGVVPDQQTKDIISFLEEWSDRSHGIGHIKTILSEVRKLSDSPKSGNHTIKSITKRLSNLNKPEAPHRAAYVQDLISRVEKLNKETDKSRRRDSIDQIIQMLESLSGCSLLLNSLWHNPLGTGQGFTGSHHCEFFLASLISLSRSAARPTDGRLRCVLDELVVRRTALHLGLSNLLHHRALNHSLECPNDVAQFVLT